MSFGRTRRSSDSSLTTRTPEQGATAVEYGLIVALVAAAIIVSVAALGSRLHVLFVHIYAALPH